MIIFPSSQIFFSVLSFSLNTQIFAINCVTVCINLCNTIYYVCNHLWAFPFYWQTVTKTEECMLARVSKRCGGEGVGRNTAVQARLAVNSRQHSSTTFCCSVSPDCVSRSHFLLLPTLIHSPFHIRLCQFLPYPLHTHIRASVHV